MSAPKYSEKSFIQFRKVAIKAGKKLPVNIYGSSFACTVAPSRFQMSFNDGEFFDCRQGVEWRMPEGDFFNRLIFTADADTDIEFYAGSFFYHENVVVPVIQVAKTKAVPGPNSIAGGANVDLETTPAGLSYRKAVVITNKDPAVDLDVKVKDGAGVYQIAGTVFHLQAWYLETSDNVRITNPGGAAVSVGIVELFYITQ